MSLAWVVHIGAGHWQKSAVEKTQALGYRTLAVDGDPEAAGFNVSDAKLLVDISCPEAVLAAVSTFFSSLDCKPVAVVCTACEIGILSAGHVREFYGLPGLNLNLSKKMISKSEQRCAWSSFSSHNFITLQLDNLDVDQLKERFGEETVIVKPTDSSGSRGISALRACNISSADLDHAFKHSQTNEIIVESYIEGIEYTVESVRIASETHIILVTKKEKVLGTNSTVANLLVSCDLGKDRMAALHCLIQRAHDVLFYADGVCHTEVIEDQNGQFWLIETAARGAGFGVSEYFIEYATGYDFHEASISFDLGLKVEKPVLKQKKTISAVRFIETIPGTFLDIENNSSANVHLLINPGTKMSSPTTDGDRIAYFYVKELDYEAVKRRINNITSRLDIRIGP